MQRSCSRWAEVKDESICSQSEKRGFVQRRMGASTKMAREAKME